MLIRHTFKVTPGKLTAVLFSAFFLSLSVQAANVCGSPFAKTYHNVRSGGIGGTGKTSIPGIGGTGNTLDTVLYKTGVGGTGKVDPGIGGTGKTDPTIGGTGDIADRGIEGTGIIGVITGFGSICVNGIEIEYTESTPVSIDEIPGSVHALKIGQIVEVFAEGNGDYLHARQINVHHMISGPVTPIQRSHRIEILGQPIEITQSTLIDLPGMGKGRSFKQGQSLKISGFRRQDGTIVATRIEPGTPGRITLLGRVKNISRGQLNINGVPVKLTPTSDLKNITLGKEVFISGHVTPHSIQATNITVKPEIPFPRKPGRLIVQGFLDHGTLATFTGNDFSVGFSDDTHIDGTRKENQKNGELAIISGVLSPEGQLLAKEVFFKETIPKIHNPEESKRPDKEKSKRNDEEHANHKVERPENEDSEWEHPDVEHPDVEHPDVERPDVERPDVERPEIELPEIGKPD